MVKLTNIAVIICIAIVFYGTEMLVFDPGNISEASVFGLRILMFAFPSFFLVIGIIAMYFFPITKEKNLQNPHLSHQKKKLPMFQNLTFFSCWHVFT